MPESSEGKVSASLGIAKAIYQSLLHRRSDDPREPMFHGKHREGSSHQPFGPQPRLRMDKNEPAPDHCGAPRRPSGESLVRMDEEAVSESGGMVSGIGWPSDDTRPPRGLGWPATGLAEVSGLPPAEAPTSTSSLAEGAAAGSSGTEGSGTPEPQSVAATEAMAAAEPKSGLEPAELATRTRVPDTLAEPGSAGSGEASEARRSERRSERGSERGSAQHLCRQ